MHHAILEARVYIPLCSLLLHPTTFIQVPLHLAAPLTVFPFTMILRAITLQPHTSIPDPVSSYPYPHNVPNFVNHKSLT